MTGTTVPAVSDGPPLPAPKAPGLRAAGEAVRFAVLGPVRAWREGAELDLGPPQQQAFFALLLASAGRPLPLGAVVAMLWADHPPATAVNVVRRYVGALRRVLEPGLPGLASGGWLLREGGGYRLDVGVDTLDLLGFRDLRRRARAARGAGRLELAVELYAEGLALWEGDAAAGSSVRTHEQPLFSGLDAERLDTAKEAADVALRCEHVDALLPSLRQLADRHPLDEPLHSRLMLTLSLAGERDEALRRYRALRARLSDRLGTEPSADVRAAEQEVLRSGPASGGRPAGSAGEGPEPAPGRAEGGAPAAIAAGDQPPPLPYPAQLPAAYEHFEGREAEVEQLLRRASAVAGKGGPQATTMVISAIGGMAGVGKTTLAVQVAHQLAERFTDGQLYVNLRGFDLNGSAMDPAEAIRGFLEALGVDPKQMPDGLEAQTALYRSLLAGRRVLVLLDNARDSAHVRPLLPGVPGSLVLITSRDQLASLGSRSVFPLTLDLLSADDARKSLARRLGAARLAAEPEAVREIIDRCGGLPLALSIITARALMHPTFSLAGIAQELGETHGSLDAFGSPEASADVRTVFSWSYRTLSEGAARLFRLLSLHPGPDFDDSVASAIAAVPVEAVRGLLAELTRMNLLGEVSPGRYRFHDLLRAYASELVTGRSSQDERREAVLRTLDHYLLRAGASAEVADQMGRVPALTPSADVRGTLVRFRDTDEAMEWFAAERLVLLEAVHQAAEHGFVTHAWQLACLLDPVYERSGHWHDWVDQHTTALAAAEHSGDVAGSAHVHAGLGRAYALLRRYPEAEEQLRRALAVFEAEGHALGLGRVHSNLSWVMTRTERHREAIEHAEHALAAHRESGHRDAQGNHLNSIAWFEACLGEYEKAIGHAVQAIWLFREVGKGDPHAWDTLAYAHHHLGRYRRARACYLRSIARCRENSDRYNEAGSLNRLGDTYVAMGDLPAAHDVWDQALDILTDIDPPWAAEIRAKRDGRSPGPVTAAP